MCTSRFYHHYLYIIINIVPGIICPSISQIDVLAMFFPHSHYFGTLSPSLDLQSFFLLYCSCGNCMLYVRFFYSHYNYWWKQMKRNYYSTNKKAATYSFATVKTIVKITILKEWKKTIQTETAMKQNTSGQHFNLQTRYIIK